MNNNIDIWSISFSSEENNIDNYLRLLSDEEKKRSARFKFYKDGLEYILSRGFLRSVLANYVLVDPARLVFSYGAFGKPFLSGNNINLKFNISHSNGYALVAVTENEDVGIDIEFIKRLDEYNQLADELFTLNEIRFMNSSKDTLKAFYKIWTRKEAIIKAVGKGLSIPLNIIDVSDPNSILCCNSADLTETEFNGCIMYEIYCANDYSAAVAAFGKRKKIEYRSL